MYKITFLRHELQMPYTCNSFDVVLATMHAIVVANTFCVPRKQEKSETEEKDENKKEEGQIYFKAMVLTEG